MGRLEAWYATFTDRDGTGFWLHHERIAPWTGSPYLHGWVGIFRPGKAPQVHRYGPEPLLPPAGAWIRSATTEVGAGVLRGEAGPIRWDLQFEELDAPLCPFPRWAWEREILPGAQVVIAPNAILRGRIGRKGRERTLKEARGGVAHIYGHGNAERWGWLHADLGGPDALEVVAARARHRPWSWLGPTPLLRLRLGGRDWPRAPLLASMITQVDLGFPEWTVRAMLGRRRLTTTVHSPPSEAAAVEYRDPDGSVAWCLNSERADAEIRWERWWGRWRTERRWSLRTTAHAEVGQRGDPPAAIATRAPWAG